MLTVNTLKGLYKVRHLPFGVTAAPAIFQRFTRTILSCIPGTCIYMDDIVVSGAGMEKHASRL